jgi:hypothetical protein
MSANAQNTNTTNLWTKRLTFIGRADDTTRAVAKHEARQASTQNVAGLTRSGAADVANRVSAARETHGHRQNTMIAQHALHPTPAASLARRVRDG